MGHFFATNEYYDYTIEHLAGKEMGFHQPNLKSSLLKNFTPSPYDEEFIVETNDKIN